MLKLFKKKEAKQMSVFMGKKVRKYWELSNHAWREGCYNFEVKTETIKRVKVLEKKMNFEFEEKQEIFLEELDKYATIEKKTKDTNGNLIYNITYVMETKEDYDESLKEKYDASIIIQKAKKEKENIEYKKTCAEKVLKEEQDKIEYDKFCEKKKLTTKKGVIIQKIPTNEGKCIIDMVTAEKFHKGINKSFPEYDVVTTPMDVEIFNYDINGHLTGMKDDKILFKN